MSFFCQYCGKPESECICDPDEFGSCDHCERRYVLGADDHCRECGQCHDHCECNGLALVADSDPDSFASNYRGPGRRYRVVIEVTASSESEVRQSWIDDALTDAADVTLVSVDLAPRWQPVVIEPDDGVKS